MTEITLSNKEFFKWASSLVSGSDAKYINYISSMLNRKRYFSNEHYLSEYRNSSIFSRLKAVMPRQYFLEIEYCALAYMSVLGNIFPSIAKEIEHLAYIEWLCYVEPNKLYYRDHFVHMLKVAFVTEKILSHDSSLEKAITGWQFNSKHFLDWLKKEKLYFLEENKNKIISSAILFASLFHDFGYGYKFLREYEVRLDSLNLIGCDSIDITKNRSKIIKKSLLGKFICNNHEWVKSLGTTRKITSEQEENVILGFVRDCLSLNHSTASSILILDMSEELYRSQTINMDMYIALQIAAEACLIHDLTSKDNYLHLNKTSDKNLHFLNDKYHEVTPLAILLIIADELSMWERPLIKFEHDSNSSVRVQIDNKWVYPVNFNKIITTFPKTIKLNFSTPSQFKIVLENNEQKTIFNEILRKCSCFSQEKSENLYIFNKKIILN